MMRLKQNPYKTFLCQMFDSSAVIIPKCILRSCSRHTLLSHVELVSQQSISQKQQSHHPIAKYTLLFLDFTYFTGTCTGHFHTNILSKTAFSFLHFPRKFYFHSNIHFRHYPCCHDHFVACQPHSPPIKAPYAHMFHTYF